MASSCPLTAVAVVIRALGPKALELIYWQDSGDLNEQNGLQPRAVAVAFLVVIPAGNLLLQLQLLLPLLLFVFRRHPEA